MERKRFDTQPCPIARAVDLFGDWWIPLILREALYGATQFNEFQSRLGISRNILNQRLQRLLSEGILQRSGAKYELTSKGKGALQILAAMTAWSNQWVFAEDERPIELFDCRTGETLDPVMVDRRTGQPLDLAAVAMRPGPGFPASEEVRAWRFPAG